MDRLSEWSNEEKTEVSIKHYNFREAMIRLAEYEDTGLTPEEIMDGKMLTGWIPVDEQMPDEPGDYWVTIRHLDGSVGVDKMSWDPDYWCIQAWEEVVVAWQPYYCPEPYDSQ